MSIPLRLSNLSSFDDSILKPGYKREQLSPGIVHIGVGNFHKAHQAVYMDRLFNAGLDLDWAIVGASVMPGDARLQAISAGQDCLTTVVEQSATADQARITGAMIDYLRPADSQRLLSALTDPAIRIVSLAITEGGYFIDPRHGAFDHDHPAIRHDCQHPRSPRTVFGLLVAALAIRRQHKVPPFTVMSCDNLPHNGLVTQNAVAGLAQLTDPSLASWIKKSVTFPNSMVDRITPATGEREVQRVRDEYGVDDAAPVFCEDFSQWVLEDKFAAGRPALEEVGVEFVTDVSAHENTKIRMLNGGHALIAYPAALLDIEFAHQAMAHPLIRAYMAKVETDEIIPVVQSGAALDRLQYLNRLTIRFANPKVADTIERLCHDGSNRQPKFIIPSISDRLQHGDGIRGLALSSALWCRYCHGSTDSGKIIPANDPDWDQLTSRASAARNNPDAWLGMKNIYGELGESTHFRTHFSRSLNAIWQHGVESTLTDYIEDRPQDAA